MKKCSIPSRRNDLTSIILGPILVLCIALATVNMLSTYKRIHQQKQASLWDMIQLDRKIGHTLVDARKHLDDQIDLTQLHQSYRALLSHFPVTIDSIEHDQIFQQVRGLSYSIHSAFNHVKSADETIFQPVTINQTQLNQWLHQLEDMNREINQQVLDNVASTQSEYSDIAFNTIIKTVTVLLVLIFTFMIYLGYLLIALRKERKRNLYMLAHDPLTGLSSRECIMTTLRSRCKNKTPFALLGFDLNKFKAVNDTFGHQVGDQLLIHLADRFKQTLNQFGIVGRMGGDEFLWIAESADPQRVEEQYTLFLNALQSPCIINDKRLYLHISAGGGVAADHGFHITELLERVDSAMYQAKSLQIKDIVWDKNTDEHINLNECLHPHQPSSKTVVTH